MCAWLAMFLGVCGATLSHVGPGGGEIGHIEADEFAGHDRVGWAVVVLVLLAAGLVQRRARRPRPLVLAAIPVVSWMAQELSERVGGRESLPFGESSRLHLLAGSLLHLGLAVAMLAFIRWALRVARVVWTRTSARAMLVPADAEPSLVRSIQVFRPDLDPLCRGSPQRGPPLLSLS
jgi:hypothetical protein